MAPFGDMASSQHLEGLETKLTHMGGQLCLCDSAQTQDTKSQMSMLSWQYSMHIVTHHFWENCCLNDSTERLVLELPLALPYVPFPAADFNLYPFTVIKHNHEYNSFSKFCES